MRTVLNSGSILTDEPLPHQLPENRSKYNLGLALSEALDATTAASRPNAFRSLKGLVGETSKEIELRSGRTPHGVFVPFSAPVNGLEYRALTTTTGAGSIQTHLEPENLIDVLRAKLVTARLGARMIEIPSGLLALPRKTATSVPSWVAEGVAPGAGSAPSFDSVPVNPNTITCYANITRRYLSSTWAKGTDTVAADIVAAIAVAVDAIAFNGLGTGGQPTGLMNMSGISNFPLGTNGAALTYANLCNMEKVIGNANADSAADASMGFATTPNVRAALRQLSRDGTSGPVVWTDENRVIGMPAYATTNIPSNLAKGTGSALSGMVYGNYNDLCICNWGAVDILVNPFAYSSTGYIVVRAYFDVDVEVRHLASFLTVNDIIA